MFDSGQYLVVMMMMMLCNGSYGSIRMVFSVLIVVNSKPMD